MPEEIGTTSKHYYKLEQEAHYAFTERQAGAIIASGRSENPLDGL